MLMAPEQSVLILIDLQERLVPVIQAPERTVRNALTLATVATDAAIPILVTEQYPDGLGPSVPAVAALPALAVVAKEAFSAMAEPAFPEALHPLGRKQVVLAGAEAHVCVLQTALDLHAAGYEVFLVADASASRCAENAAHAFARCRQAGIWVVTTDMVAFEWLGRAGTDRFKRALPLLK